MADSHSKPGSEERGCRPNRGSGGGWILVEGERLSVTGGGRLRWVERPSWVVGFTLILPKLFHPTYIVFCT